jgi:hypothetical protein
LRRIFAIFAVLPLISTAKAAKGPAKSRKGKANCTSTEGYGFWFFDKVLDYSLSFGINWNTLPMFDSG